MGRRGASLFPSLRRRERSEFHGSKLDGGRKGGITAFNLSLGSRVKGAPLLSCRRWKDAVTTKRSLGSSENSHFSSSEISTSELLISYSCGFCGSTIVVIRTSSFSVAALQ